MKEYHSIDSKPQHKTVYVFRKLDGSNIRVEWDKKKGFWKFGSRRHLIDETDHQLGKAVTILKKNIEPTMHEALKLTGWKKVILFGEFFGNRSSHGYHHPEDDHDVEIFDINTDNRGLLLPGDFIKFMDKHQLPHSFIEKTKWNDELTRQVYRLEYPGQTFEGVVCKANEYKTPGVPLMFKCKSSDWLKKLKEMGGTEE